MILVVDKVEEKTITISVTEDELELWRDFQGEVDAGLKGYEWWGIANALRKKIERELGKLE